MVQINKIYNENCLVTMNNMNNNFIDMIITSPPYDNLRDYNDYSFDFENIAKQMFRVMKEGAVAVWIVSDASIDGSETGTSFKQALYFKEIGFKLHDTMIWEKPTFTATGALKTRYGQVFEYMFILTKGKIKTFNPIKDRPNKYAGTNQHGTVREKSGEVKILHGHNKKIIPDFGQRFNVWRVSNPGRKNNPHPATFPESLIKDHIISWSNKNDIIYDPFIGSGTTAKVAIENSRNFIGSEISNDYFEYACKNIIKNPLDDLISS